MVFLINQNHNLAAGQWFHQALGRLGDRAVNTVTKAANRGADNFEGMSRWFFRYVRSGILK